MAVLKAYEDMVVLRPREDLDRSWNSQLIYTPDVALTGASSLTIQDEAPRTDHTAIAEIVHIGPGSAECPDLKGAAIGDIVALPLYGASKVVVLDKEVCLLSKFNGLAGIVRNLGKPNETIEAINNYVLTRRDRDAFEAHMYGGLLMPEEFLSDGMPCDEGIHGIVRVLLERVVHTGGGLWEQFKDGRIKLNPRLRKPPQRQGEAVLFNPLASCRFRRFGVFYHLVPYEDIYAGLEE
jgi:hypothetical protein